MGGVAVGVAQVIDGHGGSCLAGRAEGGVVTGSAGGGAEGA